ncbi:MAG TPA: DPP IV N-terminal domain-containing protein, partial [Terriglobia bacterium]|nr:DPP IV N-terminal domain-containing protein [Terriglobia bacterium]
MPNPVRFTRRLALTMFLCLAAASAQQAPFTLDQVMSAPFASGLTAAPAGGSVAWVYDARGARNIWVASPPAYQGRAVTGYSTDDGQDLGELAWSPDGRWIVYTHGGDLENGKEYPNPQSFPQGVEQDVWAVAASGGMPRRLGEGHSPAVAPRGDRVAFVFKDQVWPAPLAGAAKAEQLIHSRGKAGSLRWSPDGAKLAFVSDREDHSLIGVYDFTAQSLVYLDPSVDHDAEPAWLPDSRRIAFIRIPSSREAVIFGPQRSGPPWSIRVADAASGAGHEVWRAAEGRGSVFREISADHQLFWGAGDRIVFPWERDGWTHLYSALASGGAATLLTPGDFEVEWAAVSPGGKEVVFNSNQDDVDRRHVWRVPV